MFIIKYKYFAVDFDGTIVEDQYPSIGPLLPNAKEVLEKISKNGGKIIIWTCRVDDQLKECESFLVSNNIAFDGININHPELIAKYNNDCRKIGADIYIDDKAQFEPIDWNKIDEQLFKKAGENS